MDKDLKALIEKLALVLMQNKSILEILNAMEKKPSLKYTDKTVANLLNRRHAHYKIE